MAYYADGGIAGTLDEQVAFLGYPFEAIGRKSPVNRDGSHFDDVGARLHAA